MLDVKSTDKGFLPPRVTETQIWAIVNPSNGLMVYNTTDCKIYVYRECNSKWTEVAFGTNTFDAATGTFTCGDVLIDSRDGKSYNTVQVGTQCWMKENLNIGTMVNGSINQTDNGTIEKYCHGDNSSNCTTYGGLYQWDELMQYGTAEGSQGICPTGWHVPTDAEWCILENYVDAGTVSCATISYRGGNAGGNLKETGTAHWQSPNTGATNSFGFTGLPGGARLANGSFNYLESAVLI